MADIRTLAVRLGADGLRQVRGGHPWVFDRSIRKVPPDGVAGDLAVIFDDRRRFVAIGLYDPESPIRIRVLHLGRPTTIDADFFRSRIGAADARRSQPDVIPSDTNGYRVVNGENDGLGAIVVDRYDDVAVLKVYSPAWWPHLAAVLAGITELDWCERVVLRTARRSPHPDLPDGAVVVGDVVEPVRFRENGIEMEAAVRSGQKTGHFCDQRDNRRRVGERAGGQRVLDVFSHTGGFALAAAAGGASEVHAVDVSTWAMDALGHHWDLNTGLVGACRLKTTIGDAFEVMARLGTTGEGFGVVVVDPPSFAHRASQVAGARTAYQRLTALAAPLVESGGWLVQASCSSRVTRDDFVEDLLHSIAATGRRVIEREVTGPPPDHPVTFDQGAYLKAVFARLS